MFTDKQEFFGCRPAEGIFPNLGTAFMVIYERFSSGIFSVRGVIRTGVCPFVSFIEH